MAHQIVAACAQQSSRKRAWLRSPTGVLRNGQKWSYVATHRPAGLQNAVRIGGQRRHGSSPPSPSPSPSSAATSTSAAPSAAPSAADPARGGGGAASAARGSGAPPPPPPPP